MPKAEHWTIRQRRPICKDTCAEKNHTDTEMNKIERLVILVLEVGFVLALIYLVAYLLGW